MSPRTGSHSRLGALRAGPVPPPQREVSFPGGVPPHNLTAVAALGPSAHRQSPARKKPEVGGHCHLDTTLGPPSGEPLGSGPPRSLPSGTLTVREAEASFLCAVLPALQPIFPSNFSTQGLSWADVRRRPSPTQQQVQESAALILGWLSGQDPADEAPPDPCLV